MLPARVERWRALAAREAAAAGAGLTAELVLATIAQESAGDPSAVRREPDGRVSRGLMQVLEATARDVGVSDPQLLYRPEIGIRAGARYLARQLTRYGGSIPRAVAAYNAGSARYTQRETFVNQDYVDRVLAFLKRAKGSDSVGGALALVAGVGLLAMLLRRRRRAA